MSGMCRRVERIHVDTLSAAAFEMPLTGAKNVC